MAGAVVVKGVNEVKDLMSKFGNELENNLTLNKELSYELAQKASAIAPRLTGALASTVVGNPSEKKAQILAGSAAVPYAGVIEYGWPAKNKEAKPYLRTAVKENMGYIIARYENSIEEAIKKYNLN